jgi:hypothetical protein
MPNHVTAPSNRLKIRANSVTAMPIAMRLCWQSWHWFLR